jgi:UDP-N-acetylmuramate dehydrogenase
MAIPARVVGSHDTVMLADYTTLGLGGPARAFVSADSEAALLDAVRAADESGTPVLLLGGGSNLVIGDAGFAGTVIHVNSQGISYAKAGEGAVDVTVAAGEDWDAVVAATVAEGLSGLECLSGIPGRAGGTPVQNVGAYGHEVAEVITQVRVYDRGEDQIRTIHNEGCSFSYRNSLFKAGQPSAAELNAGPPEAAPGRHLSAPYPRYVVLDVTFRLAQQALSAPVKYAELAAELGIDLGEQAGAAEVRAAVLKIRARKGMVLNPDDPDTRSAGSFFTNPVITAAEFARAEAAAAASGTGPVPGYPAGDGLVKVPAAWLIEHAGFAKGYGAPGPVRVSSKHTLALVVAGNATTADLIALAHEIVSGVHCAYGVTLVPEPVFVGVSL